MKPRGQPKTEAIVAGLQQIANVTFSWLTGCVRGIDVEEHLDPVYTRIINTTARIVRTGCTHLA